MNAVKVAEPVRHKDGCPARSERVEFYDARSPVGVVFRIVRCQDCAEQSKTPKETSDG